MGRQAAIATAIVPTSSGGTLDLTSALLDGKTPNAAVFFLTADPTPEDASYGTIGSHAALAMGACDAARQWCCSFSEGDDGTTRAHRWQDDTACMVYSDSTDAGAEIELTFNAFIPNGVRLNVDIVDSVTYRLVAVIFNAINAYAGTALLGIQDAITNVTAPGFGSKVDQTVAFFGGCGATFTDVRTVEGIISIGMAANLTAGVAQGCVAYTSVDSSAGSNTHGIVFTDRVAAQLYSSGISYEVECSDFDSQGFSLTPRGASSNSDEIGYLLLEFNSKVYVDQHDSPIVTGDDEWVTAGFFPEFGLELLNMHDTVDSLELTGLASGFGVTMYDDVSQYTLAHHSEDAADPAVVGSLTDDQAFRLTDDAGTATFTGTFERFLSTGARRNFSAANGTERKWLGFLLEFETTIRYPREVTQV